MARMWAWEGVDGEGEAREVPGVTRAGGEEEEAAPEACTPRRHTLWEKAAAAGGGLALGFGVEEHIDPALPRRRRHQGVVVAAVGQRRQWQFGDSAIDVVAIWGFGGGVLAGILAGGSVEPASWPASWPAAHSSRALTGGTLEPASWPATHWPAARALAGDSVPASWPSSWPAAHSSPCLGWMPEERKREERKGEEGIFPE
jgi:hypothetical protein